MKDWAPDGNVKSTKISAAKPRHSNWLLSIRPPTRPVGTACETCENSWELGREHKTAAAEGHCRQCPRRGVIKPLISSTPLPQLPTPGGHRTPPLVAAWNPCIARQCRGKAGTRR